jgi:hypothetical protein
MSIFDSFLIGVFIGTLLTAVYIFWLITSLKKSGDIIFETTDKYKDHLKQIKEEINKEKG